MRDLTRLIAICAGHGPSIGIYAERLLDDPLPWTRMRSVYRLLRLVTPLRPRPGRDRLQPSAGPRRRVGVQDRRDAGQGHRDHSSPCCPPQPAPATTPGRPVRPRPRRVRPSPQPRGPPPTSVQLTLIPGGDAGTTAMTDEHDMSTTSTTRRPSARSGPVDPIGADLVRTLKELKLGQMTQTLPERLVLARQQKMTHAAFLELVLADEITRRDSRSATLRARDGRARPQHAARHLGRARRPDLRP